MEEKVAGTGKKAHFSQVSVMRMKRDIKERHVTISSFFAKEKHGFQIKTS